MPSPLKSPVATTVDMSPPHPSRSAHTVSCSDRSRAGRRQSRLVGRILEGERIGDERHPSHPPQLDRRLREEGEDRATGEFAFHPLHLTERRLVRRRQFHQVQEALEGNACLRDLAVAEEADRLVEKGAGHLRGSRGDALHVLQLQQRAVGHATPIQRVGELEAHGEVGRLEREDVGQARGVRRASPAASSPAHRARRARTARSRSSARPCSAPRASSAPWPRARSPSTVAPA